MRRSQDYEEKMSLMPDYIAAVYKWSQSDIIWKHVDWHVQRHLYLVDNGFMYVKDSKLQHSRIIRLKPNIK